MPLYIILYYIMCLVIFVKLGPLCIQLISLAETRKLYALKAAHTQHVSTELEQESLPKHDAMSRSGMWKRHNEV